MAQGRMIKQKISRSKKVNELSDDTSRLAFSWTIAHLDRDGRIEGDPAVLKSIIFPRRDDITVKQMKEYIEEWHESGLINWYEAKCELWIEFPGFKDEQVGLRYEKEAPSYIPDLKSGKILPRKPIDGEGTAKGRTEAVQAPPEKKGIEENRKEKNSGDKSPDNNYIKIDEAEKVKLTQEQYDKLNKDYGYTQVNKKILDLQHYIVNGKGAKYKDHNLALRAFFRRENIEPAKKDEYKKSAFSLEIGELKKEKEQRLKSQGVV